MSRYGPLGGIALATAAGIATGRHPLPIIARETTTANTLHFCRLPAFAAFQPALKEEAEARAGRSPEFANQHINEEEKAKRQQQQDSQISTAIFDDIKEAGREVDRAGFAWGIREAIWGPGKYSPRRHRQAAAQKEEGADGEGAAAAQSTQDERDLKLAAGDEGDRSAAGVIRKEG
ncbi:hypothetical protein MBLNU230_g6360t1 [Neophaeotheca triangularis]